MCGDCVRPPSFGSDFQCCGIFLPGCFSVSSVLVVDVEYEGPGCGRLGRCASDRRALDFGAGLEASKVSGCVLASISVGAKAAARVSLAERLAEVRDFNSRHAPPL
jgi:hypothetical protein